MDFYLETVTAPTTYPVALQQAKDALYIPQTDIDYDEHINLLIKFATDEFERRTKWTTMSRVLRLYTTYAGAYVDLPGPPLISLDAIESRANLDDDWADIDSDDYTLHSARTPALVELDECPVYMRLEYTCGYTDADVVPSAWKSTILQLIVFFYENRGDVEAKLPLAMEGLLRGQHSGTMAGYFGHSHSGYWQYGNSRYSGG